MIEIKQASQRLNDAIRIAENLALAYCHEYLLPEHLLLAISQQPEFLRATDFDVESILVPFLDEMVESIKEEQESVGELEDFEPEPSMQFVQAINIAYQQMHYSGVDEITVPHVVNAMKELESSFAANVVAELMKQDDGEFLSNIIGTYGADDEELYEGIPFGDELDNTPSRKQQQEEWRQYVTCLNDLVESHNPLIGREKELERTIQILCRKDKNNPLHIGEPGVGKTALAYGLAAMIEEGRVPEKLQGCKIYEMDLGGIIAGTAYRGEFEKRLKAVLEGVKAQGNLRFTNLQFTDSEQSRARISEPQGQSQCQASSILYIDEIHNIIGAGKIDKGSLDASNILKPYLEQGTLRFMGSTTYEEYNQNFIRSKGFARRFERVDIAEPTVDECVQILQGLKAKYEEYHGVTFTDEAIRYAAEGAEKYITGRFLPDKAIDLLDEAGSYAQISGTTGAQGASGDSVGRGFPSRIDKAQIKVVLAKICRVDTLAEDADDISKLETLETRISSQIYGQEEAVKEVTEAIQMASAGLIEDNKPMASLLFVGPTGVGKTEVAKVLAKELSLPIIRFDMSEYAEKHAVAKLIGSPAGYVGYDDGGLLTDAVRKQPHCVLLLDELEKAHQDIYDILLQVMDYAVLTDNKGQKADFRHVILLMTTNAGAQYARQAGMGFVKNLSAGEAMMKKVKSTFKPEFLNRLTGVTIFHDMNRQMAELILQKKLKRLEAQLATKNVTLELSAAALELLLDKGFSEEYGGREVDRVITNELKPILMRAILFGNLKKGGVAKVDVAEGKLRIS